ncbi:MAG: transporter substrate-binding domain-containing protein [Anaerolineales bacterium]
MKKHLSVLSLFALAGLLVAACTPAATAVPTPAATEAPTAVNDLLASIMERGTLVVSTDPNYAPQSVLKADGARTAGTKCASDQLTAGELEGFDIVVAVELGQRLGVETCFVTPSWDTITAGSWGDRWDISVGSMTITTARQEILDFTTPYYYTPAQFAAAQDAGIASLEDLNGKAICVGTATTYESWLSGDMEGLGLPESSIYAQPPTGVTVVPLETDQECAQAIASGRTDFVAYLTSGTVVDQNIAAGAPVVKVGSPVYSEDLSVAVDKTHKLDRASLVGKLDEAVKAMHADGTLSQLSMKWFEADLTHAPSP